MKNFSTRLDIAHQEVRTAPSRHEYERRVKFHYNLRSAPDEALIAYRDYLLGVRVDLPGVVEAELYRPIPADPCKRTLKEAERLAKEAPTTENDPL